MTTETTTAPTYIPADGHIAPSVHRGSWSRRINPGNHSTATFTAAELATMVTNGTITPLTTTGEIILWEYAGHVGAQELFGRTRFIPQPGGWLAGYDSDGRHIITHPADRPIRVLTH